MTRAFPHPVRQLLVYGGLHDGRSLPWPVIDGLREPIHGQLLKPAPVDGWRSIYRWNGYQRCWVCVYDERPEVTAR